jgi:hypothetical protein
VKTLDQIPVTIPFQGLERFFVLPIEFGAWSEVNQLDRIYSEPFRPRVFLVDDDRKFSLSRQSVEKKIQNVVDVFADEKKLWHRCRFEGQGVGAS